MKAYLSYALAMGFVVSLSACHDEGPASSNTQVAAAVTTPVAQKTSVLSPIELLKNADAYSGKLVDVAGILNLQFEGMYLYDSNAASGQKQAEYQIWLTLSPGDAEKYRPLQSQPVHVKGRFRNGNVGHMGMWRGEIYEVSDITKQ